MDVKVLNEIIVNETGALKNLLKMLEEQHDLLISNDVYKLEEIVERIQLCNKAVAECEVERRRITNKASMKELVEESGSEELVENYRSITRLLHEIQTQKETNDMLIKMGLGYSAKMLGILNPNSNNTTTYTSRGNYRK